MLYCETIKLISLIDYASNVFILLEMALKYKFKERAGPNRIGHVHFKL